MLPDDPPTPCGEDGVCGYATSVMVNESWNVQPSCSRKHIGLCSFSRQPTMPKMCMTSAARAAAAGCAPHAQITMRAPDSIHDRTVGGPARPEWIDVRQ
jgi:hypothetical protein